MIDDALAALATAKIDFEIRKGPRSDDELPDGGEVDLALGRADVGSAERVLNSVGFYRLEARGHFNHHFFVGCRNGRWFKLDVKTREPARPNATTNIGRLLSATARRVPLSLRRQGPVIALLGPDGAGKGAVSEQLRNRIPIAVSILYFGSGSSASANPERSSEALPHPAREAAWYVLRVARQRRRLARAYRLARRGAIVICDRHPVDVLATRPPRRLPRLERWLFDKVIPKPDFVIVLDANPATLFERKKEHPIERLERWRDAYRDEFGGAGAIVSTEAPVERTVEEVSQLVWEELKRRREW